MSGRRRKPQALVKNANFDTVSRSGGMNVTACGYVNISLRCDAQKGHTIAFSKTNGKHDAFDGEES